MRSADGENGVVKQGILGKVYTIDIQIDITMVKHPKIISNIF